MSTKSFADLGVSGSLVAALARRGITDPFPVQESVLPDVLAGRDVLVRSPTGSGKTLAFAVPAVQLADARGARPSVLVVAPTRELASQIVAETQPLASSQNLTVTAVYGGVGLERQARIAARSHILVATPGRLLDLIDRGAVSLGRVELLVLDEADRMLDMGFRPVVERIIGMIPAQRQTLLLSATLDGEVGRLATRYTRDARRHDLAEPATDTAVAVEHRFMMVAPDVKLPTLVGLLREHGHGPTLVFVRTKHGADRLVKQLHGHDLDAVAMHGNKSQAQREKALARFRAGTVTTMVATDVAARGIDVDGIAHVINFDAPADRDDYVHRVGRTGRAGRTGVGTTLILEEQGRDMARITSALDLEWSGASAYADVAPVGGGGPRRRRESTRVHSAGRGHARGGGRRHQ